jgi:hypothetical protein
MPLIEWIGKILAGCLGVWFTVNLLASLLPGVEFGDVGLLPSLIIAVVCWIVMATSILRWLRGFFGGGRTRNSNTGHINHNNINNNQISGGAAGGNTLQNGGNLIWYCGDCGGQIAYGTKYCPHCGANIEWNRV